jgi:Smg protein
MTEILQVLMHFFEKIGDNDIIPFDEQFFIAELQELGMPVDEIEKLVSWINKYSKSKKQITEYAVQAHTGTRVYSSLECQRINKKCRSLLLTLEQEGILTPTSRELVLDQLMQLSPGEITKARISWTILGILSNLSDKVAVASMERFLLYEAPEQLH